MPSTLPQFPHHPPPNPTVCLSHSHAQCFVSFQKGAQHIAAGTHHFHATKLITNAYEQEPATVTGSSHNKRPPVSEKLVRGVTNLLKVCHVLNTNWSIFKALSARFPLIKVRRLCSIQNSLFNLPLQYRVKNQRELSFWKFSTQTVIFCTAIKCNFSHWDKNVYKNKSTGYKARKWKTWKWNYTKWVCLFSCNFKGARITEQTLGKKAFLVLFCSFPMLNFYCFTNRTIILHAAFPFHLNF